MESEDQVREMNEAIEAGEEAITYLEKAQSLLRSASHFGVADLLGFDLLGGIGKHLKIRQAQEAFQDAKNHIRRFRRELEDVSDTLGRDIGVGDFLMFADFFFDGFIADWLVQSRIGEARRQVKEGIDRVNRILYELRRERATLL